MKKIVLIIICILLAGCFGKDYKLEKMGYSAEEIKAISRFDASYDIAIKEYNADIYLLMNSYDFDINHLESYLSYLDNYDATVGETVIIVNYGITNYYNPRLVDYINTPYFIFQNIERYNNYLKANPSYELNDIIVNVNSNIDKEHFSDALATNLEDDTLMIVNKYYYLADDYEPSDLVKIDEGKYRGTNNMLRKDANDAFSKMCDAALLENITIKSISAYRSYTTQNNIYNRKVKNDGLKEADEQVARPGYSEHQTGLAVDVGNTSLNYGRTSAGKWLSENSYKYGFILRYPEGKTYITGYIYEPWHFRFVGIEVAKFIYENEITYEEYYEFYINKNKRS